MLTVSNSSWTNGFPWMTLDHKNFPTQRIDQIKLDQQESATIKNEIQVMDVSLQIIIQDQNIEKRNLFTQHYYC